MFLLKLLQKAPCSTQPSLCASGLYMESGHWRLGKVGEAPWRGAVGPREGQRSLPHPGADAGEMKANGADTHISEKTLLS